MGSGVGDGGVRLWIAEGRNGGRARAERSLMGAQPTGEPAMMLGLMSDELRQGEGTEGGAAQHEAPHQAVRARAAAVHHPRRHLQAARPTMGGGGVASASRKSLRTRRKNQRGTRGRKASGTRAAASERVRGRAIRPTACFTSADGFCRPWWLPHGSSALSGAIVCANGARRRSGASGRSERT